MLRREKKAKRGKNSKKKDEDLFLFGYACKLFRDDKAAEYYDKGKHLISWQGDSSLQIDRYDCRLLFTEKSQLEAKPENLSSTLSPEEKEIEQMCNEERYLELNTNLEEYDIEQEEEMKRFKEAISEGNSGYAAVGFSYGNDTDSDSPSADYPSDQVEGPVLQPVEKFVAPEELDIPDSMEIPDTYKMNAIIEKTALFVSQQGTQMEILVKAKQAGNPQFDFLNFDNWLNPYYKHILKCITQKKYLPQIQSVQSPKQEETKESESNNGDDDDDDSDSDGEFELHPLLTASHRSTSGTPNSSACSSPVPHTLEPQNILFQTSVNELGQRINTGGLLASYSGYHSDGSNSQFVEYSSSDWAHPNQSNLYGSYSSVPVSTQYIPTHSTHSTTALSVMDLLPPPPPPPGVEGEWSVSEVTQQLHNQTTYSHQDTTSTSTMIHGTPIASGHPHMMPVVETAPILPPPPDIQPIIDKLANYVAKNGHDFENIIKAKDDPRFTFVHPWNEHHRYYLYKKHLCFNQLEQERRAAAVAAVAKGPISFSIKPKEVQKPKIEYRTNVIYKQSVEPGESEDEEAKEDEQQDEAQTSDDNGMESKKQEVVLTQEEPEIDLEEQIRSVQAAEKEAQRLEAESQYQREKQLQEERRRKASLFISMLKKTKGSDDNDIEKNSIQASENPKRKFTERKRSHDSKVDMFEDKKPRTEDENVSATGVGAPPADIIRVTQDLMAKVRAASRTNR